MKIIKTAGWGRKHPWDKHPRNKATSRVHETFLERDGIEKDIQITYDFQPGEEKTWDDPGSQGSIDMYKVVDEFDNEIELTEEERERIEREISNSLEEHFNEPPEDNDF